ncbi:hypothetical protein [Taklimakanibacter lacteus]|uniref:hypothetical protein n=1 Tax=Taklimakanibacter lacteus TaxID=2268456 RepID=UPI000E6664F1
MNRRERIRLTLEHIKVTKALAARLAEFIELARKAGYEPVHSTKTLARFETELKEQRLALARLTIISQKEFTPAEAKPAGAGRRAA